jgi:hypothetical protein
MLERHGAHAGGKARHMSERLPVPHPGRRELIKAGLHPNDTRKLGEIWRRAMEIWLPELPDIQLVQNYHRIPWNTTYWKHWPTEQDPYVNGAHWHLTFPMVLWNLQAV